MKKNFPQFIITLCVLRSIGSWVHAQITLDRTISTPGKTDLPGPDYEIKADHGQQAGAKSAVATLWRIHDQAASRVISEFHWQLKASGMSKAKAMQKAQKKFMAESQNSHPSHRTPFLLIGNWM